MESREEAGARKEAGEHTRLMLRLNAYMFDEGIVKR